MSNFEQLTAHQSFCKGMDKLTRTRYKNDQEFARVVDFLTSSALDEKDLKRAADLAGYFKEWA